MSEAALKTVVIVQCRLSSTRLPNKALLPLGAKTVLDWTLAAMKKVAADDYVVATDADSFDALSPIAERNGFALFKGPLDDVLERFCQVIEKTGAKIVVRATADNPFLFYEAAQELLAIYQRRRNEGERIDYITWKGLPHGSGVEIFSGESLLRAKPETSEMYDHEHVGPALYNHKDRFSCFFLPAPEKWQQPELRTTIDTAQDYRRACALVREVQKKNGAVGKALAEGPAEPLTADEIVCAAQADSVAFPVLCVPCVKKGRGTGHLRRLLSVAISSGADIYIPADADLDKRDELVAAAKEEGLCDYQITAQLPEKGAYALVVTDAFSLNRERALALSSCAPLVAIDEGSLNTDVCDYLLDIIPSYGITRPANVADPSFVTLPKNRRSAPKITSSEKIKRILVTVGGEDPADLVVPTAAACAGLEKKVTAIIPSDKEPEKELLRVPESVRASVSFIPPVHNLREKLHEYDVVITHYGFTAFEAVAAGCGVVLLGTTPLHVQLAQKYGFTCIASSDIGEASLEAALSDTAALYPDSPFTREGAGRKELGSFVQSLAKGKRFSCPVCGERSEHSLALDAVVCRIPQRTFRRCSTCGMLYMAWTVDADDKLYDEKYFFESYKKQYGKTYLDDFTAIKSQCVRRTSVIDQLYRSAHKAVTPTVLDVGCAFGPYLAAANDAGWQVFGTDVSEEAVQYVQQTLHYPACRARFPELDAAGEFGVRQFDALTMWYVIEHFQKLDAVLRGVAKLVKKGGIFAFSTPSASGVSARFNTQRFFQQSPSDHFTLWEPARAASILRRYGFKVVKIVYTGHHPERFPKLARAHARPTGFRFSLFNAVSHFFGLGDTFEVYCKKEKDVVFDE